jgi:hypothetical protein
MQFSQTGILHKDLGEHWPSALSVMKIPEFQAINLSNFTSATLCT